MVLYERRFHYQLDGKKISFDIYSDISDAPSEEKFVEIQVDNQPLYLSSKSVGDMLSQILACNR